MKHILLNEYLRTRFGERVQRIPLDPGLGCPNRVDNGGGCIFCDDSGSAAPWLSGGMSISEQLHKGAQIASTRYGAKKFIAYFQAFTTTNAEAGVLEDMYDQALSFDGVVGLAVSTRPDSISDEVLDLLAAVSKKTFLWVELGAQSMNDKSLLWMGRGHDHKAFESTVHRLKNRGISVVGHIIFGLPTETRDETLDSFRVFLDTGIDGYKIHALHIIKGTRLAELYREKPFRLLEMDEYVALVKEAISMTPEQVVIHRLTGEVEASRLVAPLWVLNKNEVIRRILD